MKNFLKLSILTLSLINLSSNAIAASTSGSSTARVLTPIAVTATTALQFGSFTSSATAGTITQAGAVTGGVTAVSSTRSAGVFTVTGESSANTNYSFTLPSSVTLTSGANTMTASLSYASGNASRTLISGNDAVTINGTLTVAANQAAGAYTGTYNVTAIY